MTGLFMYGSALLPRIRVSAHSVKNVLHSYIHTQQPVYKKALLIYHGSVGQGNAITT